MKHTIKHDLDLALAKKACVKAFEAYSEKFEKYSPTAVWKSDTQAEIGFDAKGVKLGGTVGLRPKEIDVEMNVPFLFKPFQSKAIDLVEGEIRKWVEKAKNGELD